MSSSSKKPYQIPFNKPHLMGNEARYLIDAVQSGKISGNGDFTKKCQQFFEHKYGFRKCLLTTSCTDALEMAAILTNIGPGDEVIVPSYTFVSTANAFVLRGAKIVFADSRPNHPNIDHDHIEELITAKTKAIVVVHYAGIACEMDTIMALAEKHNLFVIEDAAQAIDSYYKEKPLGSIGHLATFSFHETKNVISGEGGMLMINDKQFIDRAEIIWEKGTNRAAFFRGDIDKYSWVDVGSSFLPSELVASFLLAQLEKLPEIQFRRKQIWERYEQGLSEWAKGHGIKLPSLPDWSTNNAHMFYMICRHGDQRDALIAHLREQGVLAVFHYLSLHKSTFYSHKHDGRELPNSDRYSECLVRLPLFYGITDSELNWVVESVLSFSS